LKTSVILGITVEETARTQVLDLRAKQDARRLERSARVGISRLGFSEGEDSAVDDDAEAAVLSLLGLEFAFVDFEDFEELDSPALFAGFTAAKKSNSACFSILSSYLTRRSTSRKQYDGREFGDPHSVNRILLLIPDLGEGNSILKVDGETLPQGTSRAFTCKQDGLGSIVFLAEEVNPVGGSELGNVVRDTLGDGVGYGLGGAGALVFFDSGLPFLPGRSESLERGKTLHAELTTNGLVLFVVAIDSGDFGKAFH